LFWTQQVIFRLISELTLMKCSQSGSLRLEMHNKANSADAKSRATD